MTKSDAASTGSAHKRTRTVRARGATITSRTATPDEGY